MSNNNSALSSKQGSSPHVTIGKPDFYKDNMLASAETGTQNTGSDSVKQLTIVIPTFRCARYLPATIESALHVPGVPILVTDDGSDLEDLRIAERYQRAHADRMHLLRSRRRRGTAKLVNEAVKRVTTEFFLRLDGSDILVPGYVDTAYSLIARRPSIAVIGGCERTIGADESLDFERALPRMAPSNPKLTIMSGTDALRFLLNRRPRLCPSGVIYRTNAFRQVGGLDLTLTWGEDREVLLRLAHQWEIAYIESPSSLLRAEAHSIAALQQRCFGYDAVVRRAAEICAQPDAVSLLRSGFLRAAGLHAVMAARHGLRLRRKALVCASLALRALINAAFLPPSNICRNALQILPEDTKQSR